MSLFDKLNSTPNARQRTPNAQEALQRIKADPAGVLKQAGINIPNGMNNPQQIIQHLVQTGQVPQNRITQAMQMLSGMRR